MEKRIALVTGASRGIGRAAAIALGKAGAHVICVARTVGGLEETDDAIVKAGGSATLVPLNLKDVAAIDRLGASIYERWGKLDAFLANAGQLGALTPITQLDPKVFAELIDINVTANWRLIRSLDPLLRQSE
ncbi:MAG TPA: SDR family NAD(P)-dependent oxidoreductase, partial [Rhizomicrobium sp.]|nr:SDR family NAD(P)-dependent oxidoreductase [Rhizomicrobium sp.]